MIVDPFFYPHAFNLFTAEDPDAALETELIPLKSVPPHKKILLWSIEAVDETLLRQAAEWVLAQGLADRTVWLLQPSHGYSQDLLESLGERLYQIDLDLLLMDLQIKECGTSQPNDRWNPSTARFLFLTGKPDRPNRIRLLYKFYTQGLLAHCDWSLFVDDHTRSVAAELLPELTSDGFHAFTTQHNQNLDSIEILHCTSNSNHSHGYPFDGSLYGRSSFRVISETMMMDRPIISEKTWLTVINRMPFIMSGYANSLEYLKTSGYCTFENYLPIEHYDRVQDTEQRLDAVVMNTKFWIDHIHNQKDRIQQDIEHNYQLLYQHSKATHQLAKRLAEALGEPLRSVYAIVPCSIEQQRWTGFYYSIKDPGWPDCLLEQGFDQLPDWIQGECIQQFGYCPKK